MSCGKFDADDFPDAEGAVCLVHILDPALASKMLTLATERTCIVCDREASMTEPAPIDGIALPSAQTGQKTYVLFFDDKAFADADWESSGRRPVSFAVGQPVDWSPAFTLAKQDIQLYKVGRRYEGVPFLS